MTVAGGPKGSGAKAKINQDRGVVCWPFCGSYNEALLCIFDGHGRKGEQVSEYCMTTVPELLEEDLSAPAARFEDSIRILRHHKVYKVVANWREGWRCSITSRITVSRSIPWVFI